MSRTSSEFPGWYVNFQAAVLMQLPRPDEIGQIMGEGWFENQNGLKKFLKGLCQPEKTWSEFLKLVIDNLVIDAVDGTETLTRAKDVFSYIDPDFKNWDTDEKGPATGEIPVAVYEMKRDATFSQMFDSLSFDPRKLCLTQAQIKNFVEKHRKWLRADGYATFFLFESDNNFFVAYVYVRSDGSLRVYVCRFGYSSVWYAGHGRRLVVPQLA